jgi:malate dehydrogenase (oxaloacetate-decarboxylating)(NADP+)
VIYNIIKAAIGIAQLTILALKKQGVSEEDAIAKIWLVDSKGLIVKVREMKKYHKRRKNY